MPTAGHLKKEESINIIKMTAPVQKDDLESGKRDFIRTAIVEDLKPGGRCEGKQIVTRFPPEPNGYLHIGHAKAILFNFGLAQDFNGQCNLRFDDTNPLTEETEYVESIKEDVRWVAQALNLPWVKDEGKDPWRDNLFFASDYFDKYYEMAVGLIKTGKAYVDSQSEEELKKGREDGLDSPFRDRSIEENMTLFEEMRAGKHAERTQLLRAKIDMQSPNPNLRDPPIYRIRFADHHRTGDKWCIYPIYDFAHGQGDAIEGVTHSCCTLEFENHRALYDWFTANIPDVPSVPQQYEFARINLEDCVTSKRKQLALVHGGYVDGWDDPRMQTLSGLRRRGFRPQGLKMFTDVMGTSTRNIGDIPYSRVEECIRDDLEPISLRRMVVVHPLKVEITTLGEDESLTLEGDNHPTDPSMGKRKFCISKNVWIEREDFNENGDKEYRRFKAIGSEVRLRCAFIVKLDEIVKNDAGEVILLKVSHDNDGDPNKKVPGTIHWVDDKSGMDAEVKLISKLLLPMPEQAAAQPSEEDDEEINKEDKGKEWLKYLNPDSIITKKVKAEASLKDATVADRYQFERSGYYVLDSKQTSSDVPSFIRTVPMQASKYEAAEKGIEKKSRKEEQERQKAEKERRGKIKPEDWFKSEYPGEYSEFDDRGVPTKNAEGEDLAKAKKKKLEKEYAEQEKIYKAANK